MTESFARSVLCQGVLSSPGPHDRLMRPPKQPAAALLSADFDWGQDVETKSSPGRIRSHRNPRETTPTSERSKTYTFGKGTPKTPSSASSHPAAFSPSNFHSPLSTITDRLGGNLDLEASSHASAHTVAASFSAYSEQELYDWGRRQQQRVGEVSINEGDGTIFRKPSEQQNVATRASRDEGRRMAKWKIKNFLRTSHNVAVSAFWLKDADKAGMLPWHEFEEILSSFKLGLTLVQLSEVRREWSHSNVVDYKAFVDAHTRPGFNPIKAGLKSPQTVELEEPPKRRPKRHERAMAKDKRAPLLVFLAGWLFCPIWCAAWVWINSKYPRTKLFARISVGLSVAFSIGIIILSVLLYIFADVEVPTGNHCPEIEGIVVAFRMAGDNARREAFWDPVTGDIENQYRLKRAFFVVYDEHALDRTLQVESAILLDRMEDISAELNEDGSTLHVILRIRTSGPLETEFIMDKAREWFLDGALVKAFLDEGIPVRTLFLDRIRYFEDSQSFTNTPVPFKQSFTARISETDGRWTITPSRPFLMRHPPSSGNSLDATSDEWTYHAYEYMQTCWMVVLHTLPADPCLENSQLTCAATGGSSRELQVRVYTNDTRQLYEVYVREHEGELGFGTPQPTYLVDDEAAIRAVLEPNRYDCASGHLWSCSRVHTYRITKGPYLSHFWIGIVGLNPDSQFAPFEVHTRMLVGADNTQLS